MAEEEAKSVQARFIGDPNNPGEQVPDLMDAYGTTFKAGKFTEVPAEFADKVRGNSHFEVKGEKKPEPVVEEGETAETTREFAARVEEIKVRDSLESMLKDEKRLAAKAVLERRIADLPPEDAA